MVLRISTGYSVEYLLREVATGRENYYTGAVAEGEPPGRWWGAGAELLGLSGLVEAADMRAVFERFKDPREHGFNDPARWDDVSTLGHAGRKYATEQEIYDQSIEREPNASDERKAELWTLAGQSARQNVAFFDATFSVAKSVTLLHTAFEAREVAAGKGGRREEAAAWGQLREAVEEAIWAGNNAGLEFLQEHAGYTRVGHHGGAGGRFADAHTFVAASFFQHDSREGDPQLHIHNAILNRVQGPDGTWRTLDSRALHRWRPAAAAVTERTAEERIAGALGLLSATRADGKAREIRGVVEEAMALVSTRRRQVTARTAELVEAFQARYGREPRAYELQQLAQAATLATRKAKSHDGVSREELLDRVEARVRTAVDGGLAGVADAALAARPEELVADRWSPREVIALALTDVQGTRSAWTKADLMAALNRALPDYIAVSDGRGVARLLDSLAETALGSEAVVTLSEAARGDEALPDEYRLADGRSAFTAPGSTLYATAEHLHIERALAGAAVARDGAVLAAGAAARFVDGLDGQGVALGAAQRAAVHGVLTSGARMEVLVGPPGTGKSFVVGTIARAWADPSLTGGGAPRRVFGLATASLAADVLGEYGLTARNTSKWLAAQDRLTQGRLLDGDQAFALRATDMVVVDESSMADTAALAAVHRHVDRAGAKLVLVGDPRQLAAIGAGGGMDLVADAGAPRYELNEARRFHAEWERDASLRLREGDTDVLDTYYRQGRLLDRGTVSEAGQSAATAWLADTLAGKRSLLLVDDNGAADRLSSELRARLVELGVVAEDGVSLGLSGGFAGVGDVVEARTIGHDQVGYEGNTRPPRTRELFRVVGVRDDGALEVTTDLTRPRPGHTTHGTADGGADGGEPGQRMVLSPSYVAAHLSLGYAGTVHCGQGATVDTTHSLVTGRTGRAAFLVSLTRGRESNTAHVATVTEPADPANGTTADRIHRSPQAVIAAAITADDPAGSATATRAEEIARSGSLQTIVERLAEVSQHAATGRTATWLDRLTDDGVLTGEQRDRLAAEDGAANLTRILRSAEIAGHDPYTALRDSITTQPLDGARNLCNVVHARLRDRYDLAPAAGTRWADRVPAVDDPQMRRWLVAVAAAADDRQTALGAQAVADPPCWATDLLGPVPDAGTDPDGRDRWQARAGAVAAAREIAHGPDHDAQDETAGVSEASIERAGDVLGPAPKPGRPEAHAAWRAGWDALGRPRAEREELEMSDGQLLARLRGWEREKNTAPPWVADDLAGTRQSAADQRRTAALHRAGADNHTTEGDDARAAELAAAATAAEVHAEELERRVELLEQAEHAYNAWLVETAVTRLKADRAAEALAQRDADRPAEPDVTAEQWLATDAASRAAEDVHRPITEDDLVDLARTVDTSTADQAGEDALETDVPDLRDVAAPEVRPEPRHAAREASAEDVNARVHGARRTLIEIAARTAHEASLDTEESRDVDYAADDPYAHAADDSRGDGDY